MANIKPFKAVRPKENMAQKIAALPYDVYSRAEAKKVVKGNPDLFLNIDRPETQFDEATDMYAPFVYDKAKDMLNAMIAQNKLIQEETDCYYLYELTMEGRVQTGIVACESIDDYLNDVVKKHENTREEKELDRVNHVDICSAQTGPIFLAYHAKKELTDFVENRKRKQAIYDFVSEDSIRHRIFVIDNPTDIAFIGSEFEKMEHVYIADGHHRAASAVRVGMKRRNSHATYSGEEEFNYFLAVLFPDQELNIFDYNRVVKDLNGLSEEVFLDKVKEVAKVQVIKQPVERPKKKGEFLIFMADTWYQCEFKEFCNTSDSVKGLDVSLLQDYILEPILGIKDPKTNSRIDFVGGIRGLKGLEERVHKDCAVAFAMHPTSMEELFLVADDNKLMPPKSTWFEPKLRSGLFIHKIEE